MDYQVPFLNTGSQQPNPWFNIANQFVPRNLHDVIKWARYITIQSPTTSEVIRKLSTYPITDFTFESEQEGIKKRYRDIIKSLKLKEALQDAGFDFFTMGNVFISIYFPIIREAVCPHCKTSYNVKKAAWLSFKQYNFTGQCPHCGHTGVFERKDSKSLAVEDINFIKWTPEHIVVNHNPITGESEYYYKIPNSVKLKIQKGDRMFVNSLPWEFIEAVRYNQDFRFDRGSIFHLKNISSGGSVEGIAVPPLLSLFSLVFYQATLRKANEAIATEYLNPMRVIFPQAQTGNSDPVIAMSLRSFKQNMEDALRRHKQDKNHILVAPLPVGYSPIGGEGRNLLVSQEIDQAEESILLSLGVSKELLSGTTNWTSSSIGLRMMENLLTSYISRLQDLIDWTFLKVTAYLDIEKLDVKLIPFKLLDDSEFKGLVSNLAQAGIVSQTTLFEEIGLDLNKEQERFKEEAVTKARVSTETAYEVDQAHFIAAKELGQQMEANDGYKELMAQVQEITSVLAPLDPGSRAQQLQALKVENYTMYLLVSKALEDMSAQASGMVQPQDMDQGGQGDDDQNQSQSEAPQSDKSGEAPSDSGKPKKPKGQGAPK